MVALSPQPGVNSAFHDNATPAFYLEAGTVTYYTVPKEYGVTTYRYTVVNDTPVLVDPHTHRIVEIIG